MFGKIVWIAVLAATLPAQSIIPAKAGLVSYADEAYIDGRPVEISTAHFYIVNESAVLRTGAGRAEVLLGPCAAMWIDENSSVRMISARLSDIRMEVLTGSAVVAAGPLEKGTRLALLLKTSVTPLDRKGAYRFDAEPPRIKVLAGRTTVQWANRGIPVTTGRWVPLDAEARVRKFDKLTPDALVDWSNARADYLVRLARHHTGNVGEGAPAVTLADLENARGLGTRPVEASPQVVFPPMANSSNAGCGVMGW